MSTWEGYHTFLHSVVSVDLLLIPFALLLFDDPTIPVPIVGVCMSEYCSYLFYRIKMKIGHGLKRAMITIKRRLIVIVIVLIIVFVIVRWFYCVLLYLLLFVFSLFNKLDRWRSDF